MVDSYSSKDVAEENRAPLRLVKDEARADTKRTHLERQLVTSNGTKKLTFMRRPNRKMVASSHKLFCPSCCDAADQSLYTAVRSVGAMH